MKNFIIQFSRLFVGILFIISGLIKLNDPLGFSYKLNEYFSNAVFNLPFFIPFSLGIALFLVIFEIVLGIMLLLGFKTEWTLKSLFLLVILFTFLTFYSAYFDVVKDCGCFGDALHLTPWQSFTKDLLLLFFILFLYFNQKYIKPIFNNLFQSFFVICSIFLCSYMGYWVLNHLPIKDFRPYKVGTNIHKSMEIPENAPKSKIEMVFIYKVNGVNKEFTEKDLMNLPDGAEFVDRKDKIIEQGYQPPIHDFKLELDGEDQTDQILSKEKALLVVVYDVQKADIKGLEKINLVFKTAKSKGYYIAMLTGSSNEQIAKIKTKFDSKFDVLYCDATTLKTIERANPSFVKLNFGTITQKVHHNDSDALEL